MTEMPVGTIRRNRKLLTSIPDMTSPNTTCFPSHCGTLSKIRCQIQSLLPAR
ncbi:hypothetical protein ACHAXS_011212 [Conticribra weissflogii]